MSSYKPIFGAKFETKTKNISLFRLLSAIPYLIKELRNLPDNRNLAIAFPDDGAHKRFSSSFCDWPLITCIKTRQGDKRHVIIKEG